MSFPTNALPAEFQEEHGSIDLTANDQASDSDGEDEDLELGRTGQGVWLCKIPRFLMEKWSQVQQEGVPLGKIRVYDELDNEGHNKVALFLENDESKPAVPSAGSSSLKPDIKGKGPARIGAGRPVPTEYKLSMTNRASKNLFVFGEKEEDDEATGEEGHRKRRRITSMLGTVHHECGLTPTLTSSYSDIMRERLRKASEPARKLKVLDVDAGTANRLASGAGLGGVKSRVSNFVKAKPTAATSGESRTARIPRNELLDLLFTHFEQAPYWSIKALTEHVRQPQVYLKEVLGDIAMLVPRGPYQGMWTLREEYKGGKGGPAGKKEEGGDQKPNVGHGADEDDDEDDMEVVS